MFNRKKTQRIIKINHFEAVFYENIVNILIILIKSVSLTMVSA